MSLSCVQQVISTSLINASQGLILFITREWERGQVLLPQVKSTLTTTSSQHLETHLMMAAMTVEIFWKFSYISFDIRLNIANTYQGNLQTTSACCNILIFTFIYSLLTVAVSFYIMYIIINIEHLYTNIALYWHFYMHMNKVRITR